MLLAGDIMLSDVSDPSEPFSLIGDLLRSDDVVFGNLEGALSDEIDPYQHYAKAGWKHAGTAGARALVEGNMGAVGLANNVIVGEHAIMQTIQILDGLGIAWTGAGKDLAAARAPVIVERGGVRYGFIQRTSSFWPYRHKAVPEGPAAPPHSLPTLMHHSGEVISFHGAPGVATIRPRTAYEASYFSMWEGGGDAIIHTFADPKDLADFVDDVRSLRPQVDILVTAHHWRQSGSHVERDYRVEIAHAAIDAGADLVMAHGSHLVDEIEIYRGRPVFYGLGELYFPETFRWRKAGISHPEPRMSARLNSPPWSIVVKATVSDKAIAGVSCVIVAPGDDPRPRVMRPSEVPHAVEQLTKQATKFGTTLTIGEDDISVDGIASGGENGNGAFDDPVRTGAER